jgi:hypothetical protein
MDWYPPDSFWKQILIHLLAQQAAKLPTMLIKYTVYIHTKNSRPQIPPFTIASQRSVECDMRDRTYRERRPEFRAVKKPPESRWE